AAATRTRARGRAQARTARTRRRTHPGTLATDHARARLRDRPHAGADRPRCRSGDERRRDRGRARGRTLRRAGEVTQPTFEEAQRELEQIVERLESGDAELDDAIQLWERGEELYKLCVTRLDAAQGKIEELGKRIES